MQIHVTLPGLLQRLAEGANRFEETAPGTIQLPDITALDVGVPAAGLAKIGWREAGHALVDFSCLSLAGLDGAHGAIESDEADPQGWSLSIAVPSLALSGKLRLVQRYLGIEDAVEHWQTVTGQFQGMARAASLVISGDVRSVPVHAALAMNAADSQLVVALDNLHPVKVKLINTVLRLEQTKRRALDWLAARLNQSERFSAGIQRVLHEYMTPQ